MNCPKCGREMREERPTPKDRTDWWCGSCGISVEDRHYNEMKCPKCGSEMYLVTRHVWAPGLPKIATLLRCQCGHEEKVKP